MPPKTKNYHTSTNYVPNHLTVDLGTQNVGTVGAVFSSRMVFNVLDESGRMTKGFFTADSNVGYVDEFKKQIEARIPEGLRTKYRKIHEAIIREMDTSLFVECANKLLSPSSRLNDNYKFIEDQDDRKSISTLIRSHLSVPAEMLNNESEDFDQYLNHLCHSIVRSSRNTRTHIKLHGQTSGSNINRRNNAMSDCAELLGLDGLVARSAPMTIKLNGRTINGSFMNIADGISKRDLEYAASVDAFGCGREPLTISASGYRALSNMQVLDFLCGNIDRHLGNMFYTVENINGKPQLTGIQGIDNDASFGRISGHGSSTTSYMSNLDDIKVIDKALADRLVSLSAEEFEKVILPVGLSANEVSSALGRLSDMRERIKRGTIMILDGLDDANWNCFNKDAKYLNDITTLNLNGARPIVNIFGLASCICNGYNANIGARNVRDNTVKEIPVGTVINIQDEPGLRSHLAYLTELRGKIKKQSEFTAALDQAIGTISFVLDGDEGMKSNKYPETLTGTQRAVVVTSLLALRTSADEYAKANTFDDPNGAHYAKTASAYCQYAAHCVNEGAIEANKIAFSREYAEAVAGGSTAEKEASFKPRFIDLPDSYNRMLDALTRVNKWYRGSTQNFKNLVTAINNIRLAKANPEKADWEELYGSLRGAAENYVSYKTKQRSLSDFEHRRIGFANFIVQYAKDVQLNFEKQRDVNSLNIFKNRCSRLSSNLSAGGTEQETEKRELAVYNDRATFIKGFTKVMAIADKYNDSDEIRAACYDVLTNDGVRKFEEQFTEIHNSLTGENKTDFYSAFGIDDTTRQYTEEFLKAEKPNAERRHIINQVVVPDAEASASSEAEISDEDILKGY